MCQSVFIKAVKNIIKNFELYFGFHCITLASGSFGLIGVKAES